MVSEPNHCANALLLRVTIHHRYLDRIQPWVHYVPIQLDYSDLHDALTFFSGDIWGDGEHDDLARKIALAGREWVSTYWRREDMVSYMFRCDILKLCLGPGHLS